MKAHTTKQAFKLELRTVLTGRPLDHEMIWLGRMEDPTGSSHVLLECEPHQYEDVVMKQAAPPVQDRVDHNRGVAS